MTLVCGAASAQSGDDSALSEVVVTGLRRESTVQNTAAAINVISAERLERAGVTGNMSLQFQTPGLLVAQDQLLTTQVFIRGIGSNLLGIAVSNSVATYIDGIYIANPLQAGQSFTDVERVEVLKGPQATLYGRNATGGAINVVTQEPSFTPTGSMSVAGGNYNAWRVLTNVSGPIVDKIAGRIAIQTGGHKGYGRNLFLGNRVMGERTWGVRGSLKFDLTDTLDAVLRADYLDQRTSDFAKLTPAGAAYFTGIPQYFTPDVRAFYGNLTNKSPIKDRGVSGTVHWDAPLGRVTSVTSYRMFKAGAVVWDADNVPVPTVAFPAGAENLGTVVKSNTFYHETYLATDDSRRFSVIVGANYFSEDALEDARITAFSPPRFFLNDLREAEVDAWSAYADGGVKITDELKLVAGIRYSSEKKHYQSTSIVPARATVANSAEFKNTSPRIGLEYRPRDGLLIYATATSGFKSGGFNQNTPGNAFNPEKIWSYEGGFKSRPFDGRARFNVSAFYYDYKDIQVTQAVFISGIFQSRITNGGTAKLWGADIESSLLVMDGLTVNADVSLLHSEFGSAIFCDPLRGACSTPCSIGQLSCAPELRPFFDVKGNRLPRAPAVTANLGVDYTVPVGLPGQLSFHANGAYRSKVYYTVFQNPIYSAPAFWMFDASLRYEDPKGWFTELYGQNLADKVAVTAGIASAPQRNQATGALIRGEPACFCRYTPPRTYGVRVGYKF